MIEVQAPHEFRPDSLKYIFLAGSIENGEAEPWQDNLMTYFVDRNVCFLNPRRAKWDAGLVHMSPEFVKQVDWELNGLDYADIIVMYFDPKTKSPITLLELGLYATSKKLLVCCPEGFWRKANVDIVCQNYQIQTTSSFGDLIIELDKLILRK